MSRVLVTGGGGFIGGELVAGLLARGDDVCALARSDAAAARVASLGATVVRGDVLDADALTRAARGCSALFHVAGVNAHCPRDPGRLWRVNVLGPQIAVAAAARAGVGRIVLTSSSATIGEPPGSVGDESTVHRGWFLSLYEQSKRAGERAAGLVATRLGVELVVLNPTSVQGPPRAGGTGAFLIAYLRGRLPVFVDTWVSIVDVRDVVAGHLAAAGPAGVPGERYVLAAPALRSRKVLALVASASGASRPRRRVVFVPPGAVRGVARVADRGLRLSGRHSPVCAARIDTLLHGHRFDGSRAERELGVRYTPVADTFARTVAWARAQGLVPGEGVG